jgi:hypothetical protein
MTARFAISTLFLFLWAGCGDDGLTPAGGDAGPDSGTDTDTSTTPYDCANLPQGPFEAIATAGVASRDVTFDAEGNMVGSDYADIYKTTVDGDKEVLVHNVSFCTGIAHLPNGNLMFAEELNGRLILYDSDGWHEVLGNLLGPYGIAVDPEGLVYVADPPMNRILRVDPYTFEHEVVVDDMPHAAVMSFNAGYDQLFVATGSEVNREIFVADIAADGGVGEPEVFAEDVGDGWHVGLTVDACGNLYVVEQQCGGELYRSCVRRVSAEGVPEDEPLVVIEGEGEAQYLVAGIEFGSGLGGWSETSVFVGEYNQDLAFRIDIGVPSKPKVYP